MVLKFISKNLNMKLFQSANESPIYLITNIPWETIQQLICRGDTPKKKVALTFKDYLGVSEEEIAMVIKREISQGTIILQHSAEIKPGILEGTIKALPSIIDELRSQAFELVTINELLN